MIEPLSALNIDLKKYPVLSNINNNLIQFDTDLKRKKFDKILSNFDSNISLCEKLKNIAIKKNDEYCANVTFLLKINFSLTKSLALFWKLCEDFEYPQAWSCLQNALDDCKTLLKFCDKERSKYFINFHEYLSLIEKLFPYNIFISSEMDGITSECSICGKSSFDSECCHINGHLYWGEMAFSVVTDIKEFSGAAFVPNPVDKRCRFRIDYDKKSPEKSPFKEVHTFIQFSGRPFRNVKTKKSERKVQRSDFKHRLKEWPCPCGSGISFQECCYDKETIIIPHIDYYFEGE